MNENAQDKDVVKLIEREVRMREGACKLLAPISQRQQALEASKSLLTSSARILALLSQLQKMRKAQVLQRMGCRPSKDMVPCTGKVALSDLRIPLMWKDSEYFKNKGEDSPFWLPLYGNMCCRLAAQPLRMIQSVSGQFKIKFGEDPTCVGNVYCVLKGQSLLCYHSQGDLESEDKPLLVIPIKENTIVCALEKDAFHFQRIFISTLGKESYTLYLHIPEDRQCWTEALWQHIYNLNLMRDALAGFTNIGSGQQMSPSQAIHPCICWRLCCCCLCMFNLTAEAVLSTPHED